MTLTRGDERPSELLSEIGESTSSRQSRTLDLLLLSYPVWWALGVAYFVWPILTFPLLLGLLKTKGLRYPRGFSLWLFFIAWMLLSATEVDQAHRLIAFSYRALMYISVTVVFVYVYNMPRGRLSAERIIRALTLFWALVAVGGIAGILFPTVGFSTPAQSVLPQSLLSDQTIMYFVHPYFSEVSNYFGYNVYRPKVFFAYTNQWGGCITLLTPFVFAFLATHRGRYRRLVIALLVLSLVPLVISLDRGAWIGLVAGGIYAGGRILISVSKRKALLAALGTCVVALIIAVTPLGALVGSRLTSSQNSNTTRSNVYSQTLSDTAKSPLLGYGSPRPDPTAHSTNPNLPHVGTQGQYPLVLFSNGFPGLIAFVGWFLFLLIRTRKAKSGPAFWANVALLIALVEMPYYDFMPTSLHIVMIAAALALREVSLPEARREPRVYRLNAAPRPRPRAIRQHSGLV